MNKYTVDISAMSNEAQEAQEERVLLKPNHISLKLVLQCLEENETGDARLFTALYKGKCVYDHTSALWYLWAGHYWGKDRTKEVFLLVSEKLVGAYLWAGDEMRKKIKPVVVDQVIDITKEMSDQQKKERAEQERIRKKADAFTARGKALSYLQRQKHVLELAQSMLAMTADLWDNNPWVLGTKEGIIDLRTGVMNDGKPEQYIRTVINARWDGLNIECSRFELFLQEVFADRSEEDRNKLISFLQRFLGYGITGVVRDHMFVILFGDEGRNGKSILMSLMKRILGECASAVSNDVMLAPGGHRAPGSAQTHLMSLQGKRLVWASEPSKGSRFDIGQVKQITGGDEINGRNNYDKENYSFLPTHHLLMLTNQKPHADGKDGAFWARVCPIVFRMRFIDNPINANERKADTTLSDALDAEASGILAWLVRGCLEWQRVGMGLPAEIRRERESYRAQEDTINIFLLEMCKVEDGAEIMAGTLYTLYSEWCKIGNMKPMTSTSFGSEMKKTYQAKNKRAGTFYQGLRKLEEDEYNQEAIQQPTTVLDVMEELKRLGIGLFVQSNGALGLTPPTTLSEEQYISICDKVTPFQFQILNLIQPHSNGNGRN